MNKGHQERETSVGGWQMAVTFLASNDSAEVNLDAFIRSAGVELHV
jgi:hypothetical protein